MNVDVLVAVNPATGAEVSRHAMLEPAAMRKAITAADKAHRSWRTSAFAERAAVMRRAAGILRERAEAFGRLMALEMGKPLAGGKAEAVKVTDEMLGLVEAVRPKLVADGLFLVGLDIVGDKLMEVNVFSPGGLGSCAALYGVDFAAAVIDDLERKLAIREHYGSELLNIQLATM